jgi:hypothetical protein
MKLPNDVSWLDVVIYGVLLAFGVVCGIYGIWVWLNAEPFDQTLLTRYCLRCLPPSQAGFFSLSFTAR